MDPEPFVSVYVALARATTRHADAPDLKTAAHDSILSARGFTRKSFKEYADRYADKPEQWQEIWKAVERGLDTPLPTAVKKDISAVPPETGTAVK